MELYSGACEIMEANGELSSVKSSSGSYQSHSGLSIHENDGKPPVLKVGHKDSLEDEINQLFEAVSLKTSSKGLTSQASSPSRKNYMKRPITVGVPHSPRVGNSESVSLKQALRDLCISKASEMAAMKRLTKPIGSPRVSEAGRIKSLYNSVVVETSGSGLPMDEGKGAMAEVSLVPEEIKCNYSHKTPQHLQLPNTKSLNQSAQSSPRLQAKSQNQSAQTSPRFQPLKSSNQGSQTFPHLQVLKSLTQSVNSSPRFAIPTIKTGAGTKPMQSEIVRASRKVGNQELKSANQSSLSSPKFAVPKVHNGIGITSNEIVSASQKVGSQTLKSLVQSSHSSPRFAVPTAQNVTGTALIQSDVITSKRVGNQTSKTQMAMKEMHTPATSLSCSDSVDNTLKLDTSVPPSTKVASKESSPKSGKKGRLHAASSSLNGNRVSKITRSNFRLVKPVVRTKSSIKKKIKQGRTSGARKSNECNNILAPSTGQLICQKCKCTLKGATEDSNQYFPAFISASLSAEVNSNNENSSAGKPDFNSGNSNTSRAVAKAKMNSKSAEEGELSQSSKSSLGEYSTSTSNSDESNASRPSCGNRPHMSKDFRWQVVRHVKMQDGFLSFRHFNLLKKLGCGDIGTVYLAELIGSNCLFAIKVMDNEFLARRKKTPRAQTEREILRMLDHPFLPTLYAQFTSNNLSCLVMEYCPGGDLHVLRQKQPRRCFPEPAARFYVAEVLLALEYLHMLGVIYRDLKPENILVREDGHIMLTDFDLSLRCSVSPTLLKSSSTDADPARTSGPCTRSGCIEPFCVEPSCQVPCFSPRFLPAAAKAKKMKAELAAQVRSLPQLVAEPTDARSNSFVGTHEYLAPEIIKGDGHGAAVDWWTFGIFLYELLYGRTPFKGAVNDETLANVLLQSLKFPDSPLVSFQARDLIKGLLVKEPENRLGTEKGAAEIKQHPFFEGLNWALIRCGIPPELPEVYDFGVPNITSHEKNNKYLDYEATGEHIEFELF